MDSRSRALLSLNHKASDKVPVDFGATTVTGMHVSCVDELRKYYGLTGPVKVSEPYQMLGLIEDDLAKIIGCDFISVGGRNNMFGFPNDDWKEYKLENGLTVLVPGMFNITVDEKGDQYIYPQGDVKAKPSGRMPKGGWFFDAVVRQDHFDEDNLNAEDNLQEFGYVNDNDLEYFASETEKASKTGRAVIANFGGTALGDIALVPALSLKNPRGIREIEEWYVSTVVRKDYLHEIFEKQTDIALANLQKINARVGTMVDAAFICGTDFGTQIGTFCSAEAYYELYMPYYKKVNDWIHKNTAWKTFKHSCGAVSGFIEPFIESGFDILNPVQCSAVGMEPEAIKAAFGDRITFWGGGVDTQKTLPFGTPSEVREQVLRRCEIFSKNGGFVFNAIHNIQAQTPVENIVAMIDAVKEFNQ